MKNYHKNPRKISENELSQLKKNIEELGDLSGIVHDLNTDEIITGNQRSKIINVNKCEKQIIETYPEPTTEGTMAWGFLIWKGQKINYRQVKWTAEQREKACITANSLGGNWDWNTLKTDWNIDNLQDWGVGFNTEIVTFEADIKSNENRDANTKDFNCICPNCGHQFDI